MLHNIYKQGTSFMDSMLNLCGLWSRKDRNGIEYYIDQLTHSTRIMVFKNKKKTTDKEPDFYITLCKSEPKPAQQLSTTEGSTDDICF